MKFLVIALLASAQIVGPPAPAVTIDTEMRVPMIGLEGPDMDACGGIGRIGRYDGEEIIRNSPAADASESDRLPHHTLVWLCEGEGDWQGIVYPAGQFQELGDCRVSSPIVESRPYDGPCRHGWVLAEHLQLVAG